jgi:hypothetical protein
MALIYNATTWANYAINASASPEANIVMALMTADPGDTGTMATNESAYTNYVRKDVVRDNTGWTVASGAATLAANCDFASSGASGTTITFCASGKSGGGASAILISGTVTPNIAIGAAGIIPRLTTATAFTAA